MGLRTYTDSDEWDNYTSVKSSEVLHIELRKWADLALVAPLSANTLSKLAHGACDDLASCVMRAWDVENDPVIVCPAMNTMMWSHPTTESNLDLLKRLYARFTQVGPIAKTLACNDVGFGAMADVPDIVKAVASAKR